MSQLEEEVNNQIYLINNWLTANKLHLNKEKTCFTVFTPTKSNSPSVNVKLNGYKLEQVTTCWYLGIVVDNKLTRDYFDATVSNWNTSSHLKLV